MVPKAIAVAAACSILLPLNMVVNIFPKLMVAAPPLVDFNTLPIITSSIRVPHTNAALPAVDWNTLSDIVESEIIDADDKEAPPDPVIFPVTVELSISP